MNAFHFAFTLDPPPMLFAINSFWASYGGKVSFFSYFAQAFKTWKYPKKQQYNNITYVMNGLYYLLWQVLAFHFIANNHNTNSNDVKIKEAVARRKERPIHWFQRVECEWRKYKIYYFEESARQATTHTHIHTEKAKKHSSKPTKMKWIEGQRVNSWIQAKVACLRLFG